MKKKDTTKVLLLGGLAAAAFFFFRPKTAAAAIVPPRGPDVPDDSEPPEAPTEPPGTPKRNAPNLGQSVTSAITAGKMAAMTYVDQINAVVIGAMGDLSPGPPPVALEGEVQEARDAFDIPSGRTIASWITDQVYLAMFGNSAMVPGPATKGSGWAPYIKIWTAIWNHVKAQLHVGINSH